ncbi:MAG: hypothetical protein ACLUB3_13590 [Clostridium sp.]
MENTKAEVREKIKEAQKVLIGIGKEWALRDDEKDIRFRHLSDPAQSDLKAAYEELYQLIQDKDYYIVTTLTDGAIYEMPFDKNRIVAPCGNIHWRQCSKACTKDIWEEGEVPDDICPHCKAPLTGNTLKAETYIEEGYLPRWKDYMKWQTGTINRSLVILELGEGFSTPTVMRWPFEKIIYFNQKSKLCINENFTASKRQRKRRFCHEISLDVKKKENLSKLHIQTKDERGTTMIAVIDYDAGNLKA